MIATLLAHVQEADIVHQHIEHAHRIEAFDSDGVGIAVPAGARKWGGRQQVLLPVIGKLLSQFGRAGLDGNRPYAGITEPSAVLNGSMERLGSTTNGAIGFA